jgi:hypothetical protein
VLPLNSDILGRSKDSEDSNQTKGGNVVPISKLEYIPILPPFLKGMTGLMLALFATRPLEVIQRAIHTYWTISEML